MPTTSTSFNASADAQTALIKALLRKFVQVAADRRELARRRHRAGADRAALERFDRVAEAEAAAIERLIEHLARRPAMPPHPIHHA